MLPEFAQLGNSIDHAQTKGVLWIIFLVILSITVIMSVILTYHWQKYDVQKLRHVPVQIIYYVGIVILLGILLGLVVAF